MGILERFSAIMRSNINALLDKAEDPARMIDQYLIDLRESLADVKRETAGVMAVEKQAARQYGENEEEIRKYQDLAKKAVGAGNDGDARVFISKYKELESRRETLQGNRDTASHNADRMREMHDKLVQDIRSLEGRKDQIKSTAAIARTTERLNKIGDPAGKASEIGNKFADMEAKANRMLDEAQSKAELNAPAEDSPASLEKKYSRIDDEDIEAELNRLKGSGETP